MRSGAPSPESHGWARNEEGLYEPLWSDAEIPPDKLMDIIAVESETQMQTDEDGSDKETVINPHDPFDDDASDGDDEA